MRIEYSTSRYQLAFDGAVRAHLVLESAHSQRLWVIAMAVSITRRKTKSGENRYRPQVRGPEHRHVSRTFTLSKSAKAWGRKEEDRLRTLIPGSALSRKVTEAIERYAKYSLPQLKSRVARKRHLEWWDRRKLPRQGHHGLFLRCIRASMLR